MVSSFLLKILKLVAIFCLVQAIISTLIYKQRDLVINSQDHLYIEKYRYIEEHINDFDSVFLGSSRICNSFDTAKFSKDSNLRSFNLGIPGLGVTRSIYLLDDLSKAIKGSRIKQIFFELNEIPTIRDNFQSPEAYCNTNFRHELEILLAKKSYKEGKLLLQSGLGALYKFFFSTKLLFDKKERRIGLSKRLNRHHGYIPFRWGSLTATQKKRHDDFLKNQQKINYGDYETPYKLKTKNMSYFNYFKKVLDKYEELGIKVIFFNTPGGVLPALKQSFDALIEETKTPLIEIKKSNYPMLYKAENFFDRGHLNKNGAELLALALSHEYSKLKNKKADQNAF